MSILDHVSVLAPQPSATKNGALIFDRAGKFNAATDCETFLRARGFSVGRWSDHGPCAVFFGNMALPKWRDLTIAQRQGLHGAVIGDVRNGPLIFKLTSSAPEAARQALATQ